MNLRKSVVGGAFDSLTQFLIRTWHGSLVLYFLFIFSAQLKDGGALYRGLYSSLLLPPPPPPQVSLLPFSSSQV